MAEKTPEKLDEKREAPPSLTTIIKDDVVGVSDFKRSKIGSLTGFSAASRIASDFTGQLSETASRTGSLFKSLTRSDNVPSLPDGGEADGRFEASMRLHRRSERDLEAIVRNSFRSSWLYIALSAMGTAASAWSIYAYPVSGLVDIMARMGPLPLAYALAVKHLYTNWMVRRRRLDGLIEFLKSGEWLPRMAA